MTFTKINKSVLLLGKRMNNRGQSIFEYFLLTIAVVAIVSVFFSSQSYLNIRLACEMAFHEAVEEMVE